MTVAPGLQNWIPLFGPVREEALEEKVEQSHSELDEEALLEGCRAGEVSSFERLYQTHGARMKSLAANLLGDRSDAEDAVQETFMKIYRAAASFRGEAKLSTWTYRVLVNTCHDFGRRRRRSQSGPAAPLRGAEILPAPSSDHSLRLDLEASLSHLEERRRSVFLLFEVEGFAHREIGEILGISEGASRALLFEAKRELQRLLCRRPDSGEARA